MATWTDITNAQVAAGAPLTTALTTAFRDNAIDAGWDYYDASTGVIYDFDVDGTVSSFETPLFDAGYDYRLFGQLQEATAGGSFTVEFYKSTAASYTTPVGFTLSPSTGFTVYLDHYIPHPNSTKLFHTMDGISSTNASSSATPVDASSYNATAQTVTKMRINGVTTGFTVGKVWLLRTRTAFTG